MISILDGWPGGPSWAPFLVDISVKGAALLLAALLLTAGLRRASASMRHRVWSLAFVSLLALPLLVASLPAWRVPVLPRGAAVEASAGTRPSAAVGAVESDGDAIEAGPAIESRGARAEPAPARGGSAGRTAAAPAGTPSEAPADTRTSRAAASGRAAAGPAYATGGNFWNPGRIVLVSWALGALLLLGRLGLGVVAAAWTTRRATPLDGAEWRRALQRVSLRLRIRGEVRLLTSDRVSVPVTWGVWRPAVVLPADAESWSEERRRVVLLHELAHVKRRDCLVHLLSRAARALHWLNPLAWTGSRRLQVERERACDDLVLSSGTRGPEYAHHLLEIARATGRGRLGRTAWAGVAMARPTELEGRLLAILDSERERRRPGRLASAGAFVAIGALLVPIAAFHPAPRVAAPTPARPAAVEPPAPESAPIDALEAELGTTPREVVEGGPSAEIAPPAFQEGRRLDIGPALRIELDGWAMEALRLGGMELEVEEPGSAPPAGFLELVRRTGLDPAVGQAADTTEARILRAFLTALEDEDASIRRQAAHALGQMESAAAVEGLSRTVRGDEDASVRSQAAWALGTIESPDAVPALVDALADANAEVRSQATWALGMIESADAVGALVEAAGDESASVRGQIAWALGMIESAEAVPGLQRLLSDPEADVRKQAVWALGMIESVEGIPALTTALQDEDVDIRAQAAWALGMIEAPEAVPVLVEVLDDPSPAVREQAVWALGMIEDPSAAGALVDAIEDENVKVRKRALWALSQVLGG